MKHKSQLGSAHIFTITILVLALLGALGYIFWQQWTKQNTSSKATTTPAHVTVTPTIKTYTTKMYGFSFQYPASYTISEDDSGVNNGLDVIDVVVKDPAGDQVATLSTGFQGGATCPDGTFQQVTSDLANFSLKGQTVPAVYAAVISTDSARDTKLVYGIAPAQSVASTNGSAIDVKCDSSSVVDPTSFVRIPIAGVSFTTDPGSVAFYGSKDYLSIQDAKTFLQTATYKDTETIIKSLTRD